MPIQLKHNSHKVHLVETQSDLQVCINAIANQPIIALDAEFDRNRFRYGFQLNLIQIATEKECFLIDPLKKIQLEPLWKVLRNPQQLKILHAANEDIQLLKSLDCAITHVFDTEIAARLLNLPKNSLQGILATILCVDIEKDQQRSDWGKRPLTGQQLLYAVNDVSYLHKLYHKLKEQLIEQQVLWIFEQECTSLTQKEPETEEEKLKNLFASCSEYEFYVATALFQLREKVAKQLNKPPSQVFHNDTLWDLLKSPQETLANWLAIKAIHPYAKKEEFVEQLHHTIEQAIQTAQQQQLSQEKKTSHFSPDLRKQQQEEKETYFLPIRTELEKIYGEQGVAFILSKKLIDMLVAKGTKISMLKPYQQELILKTAEQLQIDLQNYV